MLKAFLSLLLLTGVIVGLAGWFMLSNQEAQRQEAEQERVEQGFLQTRQELNDKLEEYKRRRSMVEDKIVQLEGLQAEATAALRASGVKTAEELEQDSEAKRKFNAVRQYMQDVQKLQGDILLFDDAIGAIENGLAELDRKLILEEIGVNDDKYRQLRTVVRDIDSRLQKPESPLEQLETQKNLDAILGGSTDSGN